MSTASNASAMGRAKAKLHIAKAELHMDDHSYQQVLIRNGAPAEDPSSRNMTIDQIDAALREFIGMGWKPRRGRSAARSNQVGKRSPVSAHKSQKTRVDLIRAVWIDMHRAGLIRNGSETALLTWVNRQLKKHSVQIDALDWLEQTAHANRIVEQLKQFRSRLEGQRCN